MFVEMMNFDEKNLQRFGFFWQFVADSDILKRKLRGDESKEENPRGNSEVGNFTPEGDEWNAFSFL
jgi:hypothetical protein